MREALTHDARRSVIPPALRALAGAAAALLAAAGCTVGPANPDSASGGSDATGPGSDGAAATDAGNPGTDAGQVAAVCAPPAASACGNPASIIRGVAHLAPGVVPAGTSGTLYVALTHVSLGSGSYGGVFHYDTTVPVSDVTAGVEFAIDMCNGGEMWSEENGQFNLITILDLNGNQNLNNLLPDPGEAAHREVVSVSCTGMSPCLDIGLDCTAGSSCTSFPDAACQCPAGTCPSIFTSCSC